MATRPPLVPLVPGAVSAPAAAPVVEPAPAPELAPAVAPAVAVSVAAVAGPRKQATLTADGWLCPEA